MKTRQEIKLQARTNMGRQRATAILIVLGLIVVSLVFGILGMIPLIGWIITIAGELLTLVMTVSMNGAFISIYKGEPTTVGTVISNCGVNFARKAGGMLWMALWVFLWSLLFGIPGIVKSYAYSMAPYILADCPNVTAKEALKLSMRMTNGHKGKLFVMDLSFIGWMLLSGLTFGILAVVYTGPYMSATTAGYYVELRGEALAKGVIRPEELA